MSIAVALEALCLRIFLQAKFRYLTRYERGTLTFRWEATGQISGCKNDPDAK
jgi:hypothetical protein